MGRQSKGNLIAARRHQTKICIHCGEKITWWNPDGPDNPYEEKPVSERKRPRNLDGTVHSCKRKIKVYSQEEIDQYMKDKGMK